MQFIRKFETAKRVGWSASHLMRKVRAGDFPQPVQIGPCSIGFLESEITEWMENRVSERAERRPRRVAQGSEQAT